MSPRENPNVRNLGERSSTVGMEANTGNQVFLLRSLNWCIFQHLCLFPVRRRCHAVNLSARTRMKVILWWLSDPNITAPGQIESPLMSTLFVQSSLRNTKSFAAKYSCLWRRGGASIVHQKPPWEMRGCPVGCPWSKGPWLADPLEAILHVLSLVQGSQLASY